MIFCGGIMPYYGLSMCSGNVPEQNRTQNENGMRTKLAHFSDVYFCDNMILRIEFVLGMFRERSENGFGTFWCFIISQNFGFWTF